MLAAPNDSKTGLDCWVKKYSQVRGWRVRPSRRSFPPEQLLGNITDWGEE